MQEIIKNFRIEGNAAQCSAYGCGHINRTYLVVTDSGKRYILQGINTVAFKDVPGLMENIGAVTRHLQKKVKSERECLHLVPTVDGADYWHDGGEGYWRMYDFVEDSICLQSAETPEDFYQSAVAFGTFQRQLEDFPAQTLHETIVNFHNTPDRYEKFEAVLAQDKLGRGHVYFLPYLMGERSPINDTDARGVFWGLTMDTTRADMTQAVLEGVAFAIRDSLEVAKSLGLNIPRSGLCGGGSKSPLWRTILSNVLGIPLDTMATEQGPGYGAAILAMVCCGAFDSVQQAAQALVQVKDTVEPQPELVARYEAKYQKFRQIYPACRGLFATLAQD